jgi:hypothetical protein
MRKIGRARGLSAFSALAVAAALALAIPAFGASAAAASGPAPGPASVKPNAIGELDCNGLSPIQNPVKNVLQVIDPRGTWSATSSRAPR